MPDEQQHINCPFIKNERFYNEKIKQFDSQLSEFGKMLDDIRDFKNRILGASLLGSIIVSAIMTFLFGR